MSKRPKKLLDQACTERGAPSRPEPSVLGPEDQGPAEGLSKYLRVRFPRIRLFPRLYPNSSFAQTHTAPLSSPRPVPVGEKCGAAIATSHKVLPK